MGHPQTIKLETTARLCSNAKAAVEKRLPQAWWNSTTKPHLDETVLTCELSADEETIIGGFLSNITSSDSVSSIVDLASREDWDENCRSIEHEHVADVSLAAGDDSDVESCWSIEDEYKADWGPLSRFTQLSTGVRRLQSSTARISPKMRPPGIKLASSILAKYQISSFKAPHNTWLQNTCGGTLTSSALAKYQTSNFKASHNTWSLPQNTCAGDFEVIPW